MATYVLIAIVRKRVKLALSLHSMLQILSVTPFETIPLLQLLNDSVPIAETLHDDNQLICSKFCMSLPTRTAGFLRGRNRTGNHYLST